MEFSWLNNIPQVDKSIWVNVDYCLSAGVEAPDSFCALRYSPGILLIVCILNLGKCAVICYTAYLHYRYDKNSREKASAAASFLAEEDITTEGLSFASRDEFTRNKWPTKRSPWSHPGPSLSAIRWFRAASYTRWLVTLMLCIAVLVIVAVFLAKCIDGERLHGITVDIRSLAAQGLGTPQPYATGLIGLERNLNQPAGFYVATLYANIWQVSRIVRFLISCPAWVPFTAYR